MKVKQQDVNMLLAVGIIILIVANLYLFLNFFEDSLNFGESGVIIGMMICGVTLILIIVISIILLLFIYKKIIGKKILLVLFVSLIVIFCGFAVNMLMNIPLGGSKLYDYDSDSFEPIGKTRIYGDYITWSGDNEVYILNIDDKTAIEVDSVTNGPVIFDDYVFFENNNIIYQHTISTGNIKEIVNGSGTSLEVCGNNIIWYENESINLFNYESEEKIILESNNVTLPLLISDNYIVWRERIKSFNYTSFDTLFEEIVDGYSNAWTKSGIFDFWIYDIESSEKTKVLSNVIQIIYFSEPNIDIYENTIVYAKNLSIYTYNILTGENKEIIKHSKANEILSNDDGFSKTGYIRNVLIYGNKIVFGEHYSEQFKYDGTNYRCYDMSSGNNFEIDIWANDMYEDYVIGWAGPYSGKTDGDYELYLLDLKK